MTIIGMGLDCVDVRRMQNVYNKFPVRLTKRLLAVDEQAQIPKETQKQVRFLAKRFAAKEAVLKALGLGLRGGLSWKQIKITHDLHGKPLIHLTETALAHAKACGIETLHVSISDEKTVVVACVIAEGTKKAETT